MTPQYRNLTSDDYLAAAHRLAPRGDAWPQDAKATFSLYLNALAAFVHRAHRAFALLFYRDLDPSQTVDLLDAWERAFGITARGSFDQRRANLVTVIGDPGGFTSAHYIALAASIGIVITTTVLAPFQWQVNASASLSTDDRAALQALINLNNRATCAVTFAYT